MASNVLWTSVFNKPGSQSQELTRQRIVQEERCGRRPATIMPGAVYDDMVRGQGPVRVSDPWRPPAQRHTVGAPLVGYAGSVPRVRPEHTGVNRSEAAAHFVPHLRSAAHEARKREAPAGGSSSLGTKPLEVTPPRLKQNALTAVPRPTSVDGALAAVCLRCAAFSHACVRACCRFRVWQCPGTRTPAGRPLYDSFLIARAADPFN
jgi:hypothetical protein